MITSVNESIRLNENKATKAVLEILNLKDNRSDNKDINTNYYRWLKAKEVNKLVPIYSPIKSNIDHLISSVDNIK
ncbi:MAG: hypothetical protein ACI8SZ_000560 [Colwellia sp.]|jgi:hypothetical protein